MNNREEQLEKEKLLLVEGSDEISFFYQFLKNDNFIKLDSLGIIDLKGDNWKVEFESILISLKERHKSIALIMDGDKYSFDDIQHRFVEIKNNNPQAPFAQIDFPNSLESFSYSTPKFGIYLFPDCNKKGTLEDLCLESIKDEPIFKQCVESFFECSKKFCEVEASQYKHNSKKLFQAYYAGRMELKYADEIGKALQREDKSRGFKYLDFSNSSFNNLKKFLQEFVE